jgi:hypothetical protein
VTRTAGDSIVLANIPTNVDIAISYGNGDYQVNYDQFIAKFPTPKYARALIDVNATDPLGCSILDVENGDAVPDDAPKWIVDHHAAHTDTDVAMPVIYVNRDNKQAVIDACTAAKLVLAKDYWLWVATGDGTIVTGPGIVACQSEWYTTWDKSVVFDDSWHPNGTAVVKKPPPPPAELYGVLIRSNLDCYDVFSKDGGKTWSVEKEL